MFCVKMRPMILLDVTEQAKARGITTAYQLQKEAELQPSVAARVWKGELTRIDFGVLDRLCRVLKCQPGKLIKYEPDGNE